MASSTAYPAIAFSMQSRQGSMLPVQSRQMKSHQKCEILHIRAQVQQEKPLSRRLHLERCLEAEGAAQLASVVSPTQNCKEGSELPRVVYQGNVGGYSHAVIEEVYGAGGAEAVPCREMEGVFKAVETWVADAALIPIQNNLDGSIHRNYDLLLRHRLHIVGEVRWHVNHCLLAHPSTSMSDLRRVIGHPQVLSHCCETLADLSLRAEEEEDITNAALLIASSPSWANTALITSSRAASVFGLQIICSDMQDDSHNITRFLQLQRLPAPPPSQLLPCKTTISFALANGPTDLCKVMSAFALRDIKVTNLESRPISQMQQREKQIMPGAGHFRYVFFVDIEGSTASMQTQRALRQVEELSCFYRVLGSYPLVHQCQLAMPTPQMWSQTSKSVI